MAIIEGEVITGNGGGSVDTRQVVRVGNGLFGGLFAWYTLPKAYAKYQSEETEQKFFAGFVVTHDRANKKLANFGSALMTVRPKFFYDPESGMKSAYVSLLYALQGGRVSYEDIVSGGGKDLDEFIGRPAILFLKEGNNPDKNQNYVTKVTSIDAPDDGLLAAIMPLYKTREIGHQEKSGLAFLKSPTYVYEEDAVIVPGSTGGSIPSTDDIYNEKPPVNEGPQADDEIGEEIPFS
jgi:hypothetical protein